MKAAIIGGGVIGGGWAARFLLNGWDVAIFDPDPQAERKIGEVLANARAALPQLSDTGLPTEGRLSFAGSVAEAVTGAAYIQESVSEQLALKHRVFAEIQAAAPDVPLGSSTSGFKPSELQQGAVTPGVIFVAHPFNPVYLLPLVEIVPSAADAQGFTDHVLELLRDIGMFPLQVRKEIDAHIGDRLLEALWREALWLVKDGIATTEEIDDVIRMSFGLRWAQMGLFETYRIAGGEAGMKHFMEQFGPALAWPWTKLMDVPEFTEELVELIADQSDAQSGHHTIRDLERIRDGNLVAFLRALKDRDWGAGKVFNDHDRRLAEQAKATKTTSAASEATKLVVLPSWIDYNGHMTESRYLFAGSQIVDAFLARIGAGLDYVAAGHSYYTAETHIRHLGEAKLGAHLTGTVQVLSHDEKRLHIWMRLTRDDDGTEVATIEQMLLHVDMAAGRTCAADTSVLKTLDEIANAQSDMPRPTAAGRHVGQGRDAA
ncbi:carnitine 3-dehydrogenase [Pseudooceanicola sediminis]|uniref:L-carnitine dehydrogenase n=1 Tax=Pseudooceanicola sediminis TaxID=2211117 RepID=A0A399IYP2_9RHOB|nr:carnitine 3-dehydrogenase [Pseudooceanicola sediminis]KAA2316064.1 carnitine 3-dehydrogenase [Puniceibacterium sp. HSS470]RII38175.1 carnitine 3-dehydrogenase [Pseudooceanicola sediminis]|tara:strand:- start:20163 stop:21626 length:1464 start_codon:yes stop_codon:yes gene_type:complete